MVPIETRRTFTARYKVPMTDNRFLKRLRKKAKKGLRGWPLATIAFYGPNLSQATKTVVGIIPSEGLMHEGPVRLNVVYKTGTSA